MSNPTTRNIEAYYNNTYGLTYVFENSDSTPFNIASNFDTVSLKIFTKDREASPLVELDLDTGLTISDTNRLLGEITPAQNVTLFGSPIKYYQLTVTYDGDTETILKGIYVVNRAQSGSANDTALTLTVSLAPLEVSVSVADNAFLALQAKNEANTILDSVETLSQEFGILPNFISTTIGALPTTTGATNNITKGGYFKSDDTFQLLNYVGDEWVDLNDPITTKTYVDDKVTLLTKVVDPNQYNNTVSPKTPTIINEEAIFQYDNTKQTYKGSVTITGGRMAIGVVFKRTGETTTYTGIKLKIGTEEFTNSLREFSDINLSNKTNLTYFEGGYIIEIAAGTYDFEVDASAADVEMRGIILRAPDPKSGVVEDPIQANSEPVSVLYDSKVYKVHIEMYTGNTYLSIDEEPSVKLFDGKENVRNDRYHHNSCIVVHPNGLGVFYCSRTAPYIDYRFITNGNPATLTPITQFGSVNSNFAYPNAVTLSDGRIFCITRGNDDADLTLDVMAVIVNNPSTDTPTANLDQVIVGGGGFYYPVRAQLESDSLGNDVIGIYWSRRTGLLNTWGTLLAAIYEPNNGVYGKWYNLRKVEADINNAWGTKDNPRFSIARVTQEATSNATAGLQLVTTSPDVQRYAADAFFSFDVWNEADPAARVFYCWVEGRGTDDATQYMDSLYRFAINDRATRYVSPSTLPNPIIGAFNSYRNFVRFYFDTYNGIDTILTMALTVRSSDIVNTSRYNESENSYYAWGGDIGINFYQVNIDLLATDKVAYELIDELKISSKNGYVSHIKWVVGDTKKITYHKSVNQLHETHSQAINVLYPVK